MHPTELAPSASPQAEQGSSGYSTAPETAGSSTSVGSARASTRRPDHAARIRVVLQARLMALLLRSSVRGVFRAWRRLVPSWPIDAQHRSDDELSVASASSVRGRHRRAHRRKRGQRQARRPPDRHSSGSDASNEGRKGALGFNKDFPYINAKAACIKCGDRWMPGYWHRRARVHVRGYPAPFDPLADKIMCDGCRNKYPLGPYYFKEYTPYVTKAEVERVRAESSADYVNPAEDTSAAACFEKYFESHRMRDDFLTFYLTTNIEKGNINVSTMGTHEYCGKVVDFRTYGRVCLDLLKKWVHPFGMHNLARSQFSSRPQ